MKRYIGFILLSMFVSTMPMEELVTENQPNLEVGLKMPEFIIRQGDIYGKTQVTFRGDSNDELTLISIKLPPVTILVPKPRLPQRLYIT